MTCTVLQAWKQASIVGNHGICEVLWHPKCFASIKMRDSDVDDQSKHLNCPSGLNQSINN